MMGGRSGDKKERNYFYNMETVVESYKEVINGVTVIRTRVRHKKRKRNKAN